MKLINKLVLFLSLTSTLLLNACSSTKLIEEWSDPEYKGPALEKILIIGVIKNDAKRQRFEKEFSDLLTTSDRSAIASYTLLPDLKKSGTKEKVLEIIKQTGADGVMIVTTHGLMNQQRTTPASLDYIPNSGMGYGMHSYYGASYSTIYNPGFTVSDTLLRVDTKLFSAATEKAIWTGKTESFNPESASEVINELETLLVREMRASGAIK